MLWTRKSYDGEGEGGGCDRICKGCERVTAKKKDYAKILWKSRESESNILAGKEGKQAAVSVMPATRFRKGKGRERAGAGGGGTSGFGHRPCPPFCLLPKHTVSGLKPRDWKRKKNTYSNAGRGWGICSREREREKAVQAGPDPLRHLAIFVPGPRPLLPPFLGGGGFFSLPFFFFFAIRRTHRRWTHGKGGGEERSLVLFCPFFLLFFVPSSSSSTVNTNTYT